MYKIRGPANHIQHDYYLKQNFDRGGFITAFSTRSVRGPPSSKRRLGPNDPLCLHTSRSLSAEGCVTHVCNDDSVVRDATAPWK